MSYGCFNREPFVEQVVVQAGWKTSTNVSDLTEYRTAVFAKVEQPLTKDCQYSKITPDTRCIGCRWKAL